MTGNNTKNQHFVPRMYLKKFTYDGKKMCYTLNTDGVVHTSNIKYICNKDYCYELRSRDGKIVFKNRYENCFASLEDIFAPAIGNLINDLSREVPILPNKDARLMLTYFIAFLILRNPKIMNCDYLLQFPNAMLNKWEINNIRIVQMFNHWEDLGNYLDEKFNIIFHQNSTSIPFVTANYPIASLSFGKRSALFYFPLTPQILVILEPRNVMGFLHDRIIGSDEDFINFANNVFHNCWSTELLISNDEDYLQKLREKN